MQNNRLILLSLLLVGCGKQPKLVYVDVEKVALSHPTSLSNAGLKPDVAMMSDPVSRSIPGDSEKVIENLKADEKTAIRNEVEKETRDAIETISKRLQDYYSREIDDFYQAEFAKLVPFKQALVQEYLVKIRGLFEATAKKRGPLLTNLWLLTDGPPPVDPVSLGGNTTSKAQEAKLLKIRNLQDEIDQIDHSYELAVREIETNNLRAVDNEFEVHRQNYEAKKKEIDDRAAQEASRLVRHFSSGLSQRIFSKYTFQLKEIPTKTVNFPKMTAQPDVPRVTFDRNQLIRNERVELTKELDTFLSLNHYQRAVEADGAQDVTKEFIEWRTNLKSGHWESWQKSSAQK